MQTQLEINAEFKTKTKENLFAMPEKIKLKMWDPSKVKCPCVASFEQLERPPNAKQEDEEALVKCTK